MCPHCSLQRDSWITQPTQSTEKRTSSLVIFQKMGLAHKNIHKFISYIAMFGSLASLANRNHHHHLSSDRMFSFGCSLYHVFDPLSVTWNVRNHHCTGTTLPRFPPLLPRYLPRFSPLLPRYLPRFPPTAATLSATLPPHCCHHHASSLHYICSIATYATLPQYLGMFQKPWMSA